MCRLGASSPSDQELKAAMEEMERKYPGMGWGEQANNLEFRPKPVKAPKLPQVDPVKKPTQTYDPRSNDKTLDDGWIDGWPPNYEDDERDAIMFFS